VFFVELKSAQNNKDMFNAEYTEQCIIKFEPPKHKSILLHVQTADNITIPKIIALSNQEVSNVHVNI
jgi:hypothetical protein